MKIVFLAHTSAQGTFKVGSHHLTREFARLGHEVWHVSTPRSIKGLLRSHSALEWEDGDGVKHWVPRTFAPVRYWHNTGSLRRQFRRRGLDHTDIVVIDQPLLSGVCRLYKNTPIVYRPTDICGTETLIARQSEIVARAAAVVATSSAVLSELQLPNSMLSKVIPNGVHFEHFQKPFPSSQLRNGFVYVGSLSARFDWEAIRVLSAAFPNERIDVYGPPITRPATKLGENVSLRGPLPYQNLPETLGRYRVGLLPLSSATVNKGRSPMKFYEYSAVGLAILARRVPSLVEDFGLDQTSNGYGYSDYAELVQAAGRALSHRVPDEQAVRAAQSNDWTAKAKEFEHFLGAIVRHDQRTMDN